MWNQERACSLPLSLSLFWFFFFFFGLLHCFKGTSYSGISGKLKQFLAKARVSKEKVQIKFQV